MLSKFIKSKLFLIFIESFDKMKDYSQLFEYYLINKFTSFGPGISQTHFIMSVVPSSF